MNSPSSPSSSSVSYTANSIRSSQTPAPSRSSSSLSHSSSSSSPSSSYSPHNPYAVNTTPPPSKSFWKTFSEVGFLAGIVVVGVYALTRKSRTVSYDTVHKPAPIHNPFPSHGPSARAGFQSNATKYYNSSEHIRQAEAQQRENEEAFHRAFSEGKFDGYYSQQQSSSSSQSQSTKNDNTNMNNDQKSNTTNDGDDQKEGGESRTENEAELDATFRAHENAWTSPRGIRRSREPFYTTWGASNEERKFIPRDRTPEIHIPITMQEVEQRQLLGLPPSVPLHSIPIAKIKNNYRLRALVHHPDTESGSDTEFQRLQAAYEAIIDKHELIIKQFEDKAFNKK